MNNGLSRPLPNQAASFDQIDRKIIGELVSDGRVPFAELGRRVNLSSPAVAERVRRLEHAGVITGYRAEIDPRALGYPLTAIVRVKPVGGQLRRIQELAAQIPEVAECHRITGEDCFYLKVHLRSIDVLGELLDRFLAYGETTTSIINASPVPGRSPPPVAE
ncbi:MAG TPA: Lrp/AsnC family transcriptional regulator [Candidatus Dormibacteraeota bacterium]|jgi:Lrp/AsnC family leucine-responsive transcriptional regulator